MKILNTRILLGDGERAGKIVLANDTAMDMIEGKMLAMICVFMNPEVLLRTAGKNFIACMTRERDKGEIHQRN